MAVQHGAHEILLTRAKRPVTEMPSDGGDKVDHVVEHGVSYLHRRIARMAAAG